MSAPFTIEEALESAQAHATTAAKLRSEADEIGADGLLRLATEHERSGLTMRAYADAEKRLAEIAQIIEGVGNKAVEVGDWVFVLRRLSCTQIQRIYQLAKGTE